jgi:hypothetical protein
MAYTQGTDGQILAERTKRFYRTVLEVLRRRKVGFMVGGSHAAAYYTGRTPHTKDLDVFLPPAQVEPALEALECAGIDTERPYPFWLAKARQGDDFVDFISRAASGLWEVQDDWLARSRVIDLWGVPAPVSAIEEMVWTKASLMDRTRFDGNDILHLLQAQAHELDWDRLRHLAGEHWRLLLVHLTLFGYVYPDLMTLVPRYLLAELSLHLMSDTPASDSDEEPLCRGTLISNTQYQVDIEELGYRDARLRPAGRLDPKELEPWVEAVKRGET